MNLNIVEVKLDLLLCLHAELFEKLGLHSDSADSRVLKEAIEGGHGWVFETWFEQADPAVAKEVDEILRMWLYIEGTWAALSSEDRHLVVEAAPKWSQRVSFVGFDDHQEAEHLRVARFMISPLGRFHCFRERDFKATRPTLNTLHRPMLRTLKRICDGGMSVMEQFIEVLNAPDNGDDLQAAA